MALIADGDILDNNDQTTTGTLNVEAAELLMIADADATGGGTIGEPDVLTTRTPGVNLKAIDTSVSTLAASSAEGIYVQETNDITVDTVTVSVARADFDSGTTSVPTAAETLEDLTTTTNGPVKLVSSGGTITVEGGTDTTGAAAHGTGDVLLEARGTASDVILNADVSKRIFS